MFNLDGVENPMNNFNFHLPKEYLVDDERIWLEKNLQANFFKLFACSVNLVQVQRDYCYSDGGKKNGSLNVSTFSTNSIEYFFIKINTIFEQCYQIYDKLPIKRSDNNKFKRLDKDFEDYITKTDSQLTYSWYKEVNEVRNRIIHGGYSIKTFVEDGRILFQAYDRELNEQIRNDHGYFKENSNLIYLDYYMAFFTRVTHWYIQEFFDFVLFKLNIYIDDANLEPYEKMHKDSGSSRVWFMDNHLIIEQLIKQLSLKTV